MRPAISTSASVSTATQLWKSPVPYLFGGLTLMLVLIAVALVVLVCSQRKRASSSSGEGDDKPAMPTNTVVIDVEPKFVVIMAGDDKPTYLAKPVNSTTCSSTSQQV
ncbi:Protein GLUTAMINE DUMPER 2 [Morella rubra]|uniref:Protein GLUTAMINE DUMPER 2 n=1 Tax=Morella rubra TaxID=262757 RepID=A0A6A1VFA6_9ROSI|nr:Protein GLUTAMINE DUMPER 2 [Morella rubra]